jgi:hypothetical protein
MIVTERPVAKTPYALKTCNFRSAPILSAAAHGGTVSIA